MALPWMPSTEDRDILRRMMSWWRGQSLSTPQRPRTDIADDPPAPELYAALAPPAGIPALSSDTDYGTGTGSPSGTGGGNTPGVAECAIYRLVTTSGVADLTDADFTRDVYNLAGSAIPGGTWILAARDKFGDWWALPAGTSTATRNSSCRVTVRGVGDQTCTSGDERVAFFPSANAAGDPYSWDTDGYLTETAGTAPNDLFTFPFDGEYLVQWQLYFDASGVGGANHRIGAGAYYHPVSASFLHGPVCVDYWQRVALLNDALPVIGKSGSVRAKAGDTLDIRMGQAVTSGNYVLRDADGANDYSYCHIRFMGPLA